MIATGVFAALINLSFPATIVILSTILIGIYVAKGLFWALTSGWMSSTSAAAGLAAIGAIVNLIDDAMMVNAYGIIGERTGSHTLAMLSLAALCLAGDITMLTTGRHYLQTTRQEEQMTRQ